MDKFKFRMDNLIKNMVYNRKLTIVVLITIVISMFFPFMTISNLLYQARQNLLSGKYKEGDLKVSYVSKQIDPEVLSKKLGNLFDYGVDFFFINPLSPIVIDDEVYVNTIAGIDSGIIKRPMIILEGRNFTEEELKNGADVALIRPVGKELLNVKIGDYIYHKGKRIEVIGKYYSRDVFASISVPAKTLSEISKSDGLQYYLLFSDVKENPEDIVNTIRKNIEGISSDRIMYADYNELVRREGESKILNFKYNALSGILISIVSIITIIAIYIGRLLQNKKNIGIKLSQGSTKREIIMDSIIEVMIFSSVGIVINLILFVTFKSFLSSFMQVYDEILFYIVSIIISIAISVIIGAVGGLYITKSNVSDMVGA